MLCAGASASRVGRPSPSPALFRHEYDEGPRRCRLAPSRVGRARLAPSASRSRVGGRSPWAAVHSPYSVLFGRGGRIESRGTCLFQEDHQETDYATHSFCSDARSVLASCSMTFPSRRTPSLRPRGSPVNFGWRGLRARPARRPQGKKAQADAEADGKMGKKHCNLRDNRDSAGFFSLGAF